MMIHPPILYTGYVGFIIPFAFGIAVLADEPHRHAWIEEVRRWTLFCRGFPRRRRAPGRAVGLRRARLGRLLGLGPGGERVAHAVARRHRLPALRDDPGAHAAC